MRNQFEQDDAIFNVVKGNSVFRDMEKLLGVPKDTCFHQLKQFFESSQSIQARDWVQFYKLYWTGFDAWSIGSLLLKILQYQMSWTEFLQEPEWQEKQTLVKLALKGLLNPNPHKRLDCLEALFLMDPSNKWVNQFGKSWLEKRQRLRSSQQKN
jgi:hypothetical protein